MNGFCVFSLRIEYTCIFHASKTGNSFFVRFCSLFACALWYRCYGQTVSGAEKNETKKKIVDDDRIDREQSVSSVACISADTSEPHSRWWLIDCVCVCVVWSGKPFPQNHYGSLLTKVIHFCRQPDNAHPILTRGRWEKRNQLWTWNNIEGIQMKCVQPVLLQNCPIKNVLSVMRAQINDKTLCVVRCVCVWTCFPMKVNTRNIYSKLRLCTLPYSVIDCHHNCRQFIRAIVWRLKNDKENVEIVLFVDATRRINIISLLSPACSELSG